MTFLHKNDLFKLSYVQISLYIVFNSEEGIRLHNNTFCRSIPFEDRREEYKWRVSFQLKYQPFTVSF